MITPKASFFVFDAGSGSDGCAERNPSVICKEYSDFSGDCRRFRPKTEVPSGGCVPVNEKKEQAMVRRTALLLAWPLPSVRLAMDNPGCPTVRLPPSPQAVRPVADPAAAVAPVPDSMATGPQMDDGMTAMPTEADGRAPPATTAPGVPAQRTTPPGGTATSPDPIGRRTACLVRGTCLAT